MGRVFQRPETVVIEAISTNRKTGEMEYPTGGVRITITNPKGVVKVDGEKDEGIMTPIEEGLYEYRYRSKADDEPGWWRATGKSIDGVGEEGTDTVIVDGGFQLQ